MTSTTAKRIREGMDIRGIKQSELVEKTGISKGALSSYLSGRYIPKQNNIFLIAKALDVSEAWLMGGDVPMERISHQPQNIEGVDSRLLDYFHQLNDTGKDKVVDYAADMTQNPNYTLSSVPVLQAAHNDNAEDPEELARMQQDMDMIKEIHRKIHS